MLIGAAEAGFAGRRSSWAIGSAAEIFRGSRVGGRRGGSESWTGSVGQET